jgi:hypothetical protein
MVLTRSQPSEEVEPNISSSSPLSAAPPVVLKLELEDYLPTFSGDPDEDPDYFIQRLEEYFAEPANTHLSEEGACCLQTAPWASV